MRHNAFDDYNINLYTVPSDFMESMAKRVAKLEKEARRNRRRVGILAGVCIGLAIDIYTLVKERKTAAKEDKKSGE